ncbi:MAG: OmpH family outer membrane protein [Deltaproteobacteria bacterium]|nr:OmpH family outer membrane protein [bacterium]MCB9476740.1 OmpH family outer membrane protein [Deltaproteobacteria bacterium]MCB9487445.1 OmpH family outer membrane protein [Deltaproteobacteria bacterium]
MMRKLAVLTLALAMITATASLAAAAGEIAFVDFEKVVSLTDKGKNIQKQLAALKDDMELQLKEKELALQKSYKEFQDQADALSDEAKNTKVNELRKAQMEAQQLQYNLMQKMEDERLKLLRSFASDLSAVASEVGRAAGYKMVFLKNVDPIAQISMVLYADPSIDLTDQVIAKLNAG